jgi:serine/threonine-protein kinase
MRTDGVIHRDIKPENILLSEQHAVVADFGIARALDEAAAGGGSGAITRTGQTIGTPAYMSPEQVTGERVIDGRTDLYALGCTLFEMLSGQAPWSGGTLSSMVARRLAEPPPRIRTLEPSVPPAVETALTRALAREPDQRFSTPAEFATALETTGSQPMLAIPRGRRRAVLLVAAALPPSPSSADLAVGVAMPAITSLVIAPDSTESSVAYLSDGFRAVANLLRRCPSSASPRQPVAQPAVSSRRWITCSSPSGSRSARCSPGGWCATGTQCGSSPSCSGSGGELEWTVRYARPFADVAAIQGRPRG